MQRGGTQQQRTAWSMRSSNASCTALGPPPLAAAAAATSPASPAASMSWRAGQGVGEGAAGGRRNAPARGSEPHRAAFTGGSARRQQAAACAPSQPLRPSARRSPHLAPGQQHAHALAARVGLHDLRRRRRPAHARLARRVQQGLGHLGCDGGRARQARGRRQRWACGASRHSDSRSGSQRAAGRAHAARTCATRTPPEAQLSPAPTRHHRPHPHPPTRPPPAHLRHEHRVVALKGGVHVHVVEHLRGRQGGRVGTGTKAGRRRSSSVRVHVDEHLRGRTCAAGASGSRPAQRSSSSAHVRAGEHPQRHQVTDASGGRCSSPAAAPCGLDRRAPSPVCVQQAAQAAHTGQAPGHQRSAPGRCGWPTGTPCRRSTRGSPAARARGARWRPP